MKYDELDSKLTGRNKDARKLENNTHAVRFPDCITIRLHATHILTFYPNGKTVVTSGGWKTVTTKSRLNQFMPHGLSVWQKKGLWYWNTGVLFTDGDVIYKDGTVAAQAIWRD